METRVRRFDVASLAALPVGAGCVLAGQWLQGGTLSALLHGADNGGKVIVHQHHIRCLFRNISACDPHGDTDICLF